MSNKLKINLAKCRELEIYPCTLFDVAVVKSVKLLDMYVAIATSSLPRCIEICEL